MAEYIEREAVLRAVQGQRSPCRSPAQNRMLDCLKAAVIRISAADVAPVVHGRWISWEEAGNFVPSPDRHECSVCHDAAQVLVNGFELLSDYCPNCGAKMDGGADNDTN